MNVDELHSGHGRRRQDGTRYGVRDVVKLEIKEDAVPEGRNLPDGFWTGVAEELAADFEHSDHVSHLLGKRQGGFQRIKVEGYDKAAARMSVEGHGTNPNTNRGLVRPEA
jgi:hypothetical protein